MSGAIASGAAVSIALAIWAASEMYDYLRWLDRRTEQRRRQRDCDAIRYRRQPPT